VKNNQEGSSAMYFVARTGTGGWSPGYNLILKKYNHNQHKKSMGGTAIPTVKLMKKRILKPRSQASEYKGDKLMVSISIGHRMNKRLQAAIDRMAKTTERELTRLFERDVYAGSYGMDDENIGSQARMLFGRLWNQFEKMFAAIAYPVTKEMAVAVERNSAVTLAGSITKATEGLFSLSADAMMTAELKEVIAASVAKNVALIKRVPAEYLSQIETAAYQAITTGRGLADLKPALAKQGVKVKNWAHNVSMDQTRKVYADITAHRMESIGLDEYDWLHSGGSSKPRTYHQHVLNGRRFKLSDPPVIQMAKGKTPEVRGKPGDLVNCRCVMRPIVSFKRST